MERLAKLSKIDDTSSHNSLYYTKAVEAELKKNGKGVTRLEVYPAVKEYIQNNKVIEDATNRAAKHQVKVNDKPKDDGSGDKDKAELKKAEEKYAKDLEELSARREIEKLTVNDYNKALDDLNRKYYVEARGSKNEKILKSKYFKNLEDAVNNPLFDQSQFDLEKVQSDYYASLGELTAKRQSGAIKEEDYQKSLIELSNSTTDAVGAIKNMGLEGEGFIATLIANRRLAEAALKVDIKPKERDTTFDYKKTALDIKGEELEVAKEYVEELKKKIDEGATYLQEQFNNAMSNVTNLKDALKLAEVQVDIKNFNKALNEGLYSGMKDIVSNSDRVVGAFSNLRDVMNDVNATEWERIMAVWNTMTTLADSILSVIDVIKTLTKVTEQLSDAEQNEAAINAAVTTQKVANAEIEIASDLAVAGVAKATTTDEATANAVKAATDTALTQTKVTNAATEISADIATAAVSKATAGEELVANTVKGVSSAAAGAAKLPFPASIIAIAGAIAAVTALFAGISKFANGGIVSGNSTSGDKVLARVNSGEMILNRGQQSKLFSALNSGEGLSSQVRGGDVKFRISGTDLVGVYNNYIKRRSKIQ
jgi:hypothetical protein